MILKADVTRLGAGTVRGVALAGGVGGPGLEIAGIEFGNRCNSDVSRRGGAGVKDAARRGAG